jgi:porphobilinogen synthase
MLKAAAENGWLDGRRALLESQLALRRAGADRVLAYAAVEESRWLEEG